MTSKALIRLRVCTGWSEALLVAYTTLLDISSTGSMSKDMTTSTIWICDQLWFRAAGTRSAQIYEYFLLNLTLSNFLFNSIPKIWEKNRPGKNENYDQTESWGGGGGGGESQDNDPYEYGGGGSDHKIMAPSIWGVSSQDNGPYEHFGGSAHRIMAPMSLGSAHNIMAPMSIWRGGGSAHNIMASISIWMGGGSTAHLTR